MKRIHYGGVALLVFCLLDIVAVNVRAQEQSPKEQGSDATPVGLRLMGRVQMYGRSWQFEIVTEGYDFYYRKEWAGEEEHREWKDAGFWDVALIIGDFGGAMRKSWSEFGGRGGGNYGDHGKHEVELARRLWTGDRFTGVPRDKLRAELAKSYVEEFTEPISGDRFSVPFVIRWTDSSSQMPEKTKVYTVDKVEFRFQRDPQFFTAAKARYFPNAKERAKSELLR